MLIDLIRSKKAESNVKHAKTIVLLFALAGTWEGGGLRGEAREGGVSEESGEDTCRKVWTRKRDSHSHNRHYFVPFLLDLCRSRS